MKLKETSTKTKMRAIYFVYQRRKKERKKISSNMMDVDDF